MRTRHAGNNKHPIYHPMHTCVFQVRQGNIYIYIKYLQYIHNDFVADI